MIGVILWSSEAKEKAVVWCEDHAALAYLQGRENLAAGNDWPEAGDLVELDCETIEDLRHARAVTLVSGINRSELPGLLRDMRKEGQTGQPVLRVISNANYAGNDLQPQKVAAAG